LDFRPAPRLGRADHKTRRPRPDDTVEQEVEVAAERDTAASPRLPMAGPDLDPDNWTDQKGDPAGKRRLSGEWRSTIAAYIQLVTMVGGAV
jgi:hypothetical protein